MKKLRRILECFAVALVFVLLMVLYFFQETPNEPEIYDPYDIY
jgi:CHASE3 domain sensor protein